MSRPLSPIHFWLHGVAAIVLSVVLAGVALWRLQPQKAAVIPPPAEGPVRHLDFALTDHHGKPFASKDLAGRWALVYFGYTYCPDICPTELGFMKKVLNALGPDAAGVQPLLITVDPQRDSVEVLAGYAPLFHPKILGLTGTPEAIKAAATSVGAVFQRVDIPTGPKDYYLVNHSLATFLVGPDGRVRASYTSQLPPAAVADEIRRHIAHAPTGVTP